MGQDASKKVGDSQHYTSIPGMIRHWSGGSFIHPMGGEKNPNNDTKLVSHNATHANMRFRFVQFEGVWGYIEHVASGKVVHPWGGSIDPYNDTNLVLHEDRHAAALFTFDYTNHLIVHRSNKYIHPKGGSVNPKNDTILVLHEDVHDGMRWVVVTTDNIETPLYM